MPQGGSPQRKFNGARLRVSAALVVAAVLAGCSSTSSTLSNLPAEMGGLPADAPAGPAPGQQLAYPAVHDMPPPRQTTAMTPEQVKQAEAEMARMRDRPPKPPAEPKSR
jgi:hypothetical protein